MTCLIHPKAYESHTYLFHLKYTRGFVWVCVCVCLCVCVCVCELTKKTRIFFVSSYTHGRREFIHLCMNSRHPRRCFFCNRPKKKMHVFFLHDSNAYFFNLVRRLILIRICVPNEMFVRTISFLSFRLGPWNDVGNHVTSVPVEVKFIRGHFWFK